MIHLRFIGLQSESWAISLGKPFCTVSPGVTPASAGLQLFVSAAQLDDMLSVGLHKQSLRYVGSVALLDHLVALLKAGQRMIDMRFKHQVFHEADAFREAYASEQWGKG